MRYLVLFICLVVGSAVANEEITERNELKKLAYALFDEERFDELEKLASDYRTRDIKTASGTLKYPLIYEGIGWYSVGIENNDDKAWNQRLDKADRQIEAFPESAIARITRASMDISRGYGYRGSKFISQTPQSDLDLAVKYISEGVENLIAHQDLGKTEPRWYKLMLSAYTVMGAPTNEYEQLFEEAIGTYPSHDSFYFNATQFYSPQYSGSSKDIDELALLAMKNTEANRGYEMYARVYWAAPPLPDGEFHLMQNEINWEYFVLGIDAVLNKYPTQWNINHFAFFVCMGGDWQKTKELLAKIEEPIVLAAWQGQHNYNFCKRTISLWERRQPKLD